MPEITTWPDVECPLRFEYSPAAMEQIRRRVLAAAAALPGTGLGVGGLLRGEREGAKITVLDSVELRCSHALGPRFRLTPEETQEARDSILATGTLPVIGWFFSRSRGELDMAPDERALFQELFPTQWQVTLIMIPETTTSVRAAFFFQDPGGELVRGSEETLRPWISERGIAGPPEPAKLAPPQSRPAGRKLIWLATAILALAAGAAIFLLQQYEEMKPQTSPTTQIP